MTIRTESELLDALGNNNSRLVIDKAAVPNTASGQLLSFWRAAGQPAQAAIPGTTPAVPTHATLGAPDFTQQTAPATSHLGWMHLSSNFNTQTIEIHDRIAHMGGLVLNVTTAQPITGLDLAPGALNPPADRIGAADFSDVQWFLEVYADGGATAANATIAVVYNDASTGSLLALAVGGTLRAGRMIPLTPLIPPADQGKRIRAITSVTLSANTGVAGNFGFTCTRQRTACALFVANKGETFDAVAMGFPSVPNGSCLMYACLTTTTSSGTIRGQGKIVHG